jgi:hypothetical protein
VQRIQTVIVQCAQGMNGHAGERQTGLSDQSGMIRTEVDFVEQDDRLGPTAPDRREIALDATRIEVAVDRGDDECDVDVGRQDLFMRQAARGASRDDALPRQDVDRHRQPDVRG